jgi:hypothetical protein
MSQFKLLTEPDHQPKAKKGKARGYLTFVLHLAPGDTSGFEVCPGRSAACTDLCLNKAGRGIMDGVQRARIARTQWYFADRAGFMARLCHEIEAAIRYAEKRGMKAAFRLNGTSDIPWHRVPAEGAPSVMERFAGVPFYDYTKVAKRVLRERLPANYDLTFSLSESNEPEARGVLAKGGRVAVVFRDAATVTAAVREQFWGAATIAGDDDDLRFLDAANSVVALYVKGNAAAKGDGRGFVRDVAA